MPQIITDKSLHTQEELTLSRQNLWIVFFIYLSIFINSYVFFKEPFEFYFGYLIYILLLPVFIARYGFNRNLLLVFSILLITGIINIFIGGNTAQNFFKVFTGLTLSYFFYYYVIVEFNYKVEILFRWFMIGAYVAALIGIFQFVSYQIGFVPGYNYRWILNKWGIAPGGLFGIRINSIFAEPTHLASLLSAAFFVSVYNVSRKTGYFISKTKSLVIIVAYFLSFSGVGQLGIFLTMILLAMNFGLVRYVLIAIPLLALLFGYLYDNVTDFRDRYDGLVSLYSGEEFVLGKTHGSSFILYNNFHVATENFKNNFMFGSGIGSHPVAFDKYSLAKHITVYGFNLNSADANSMLLRLISETGLFGVVIFIFILFKYYVPRAIDYESPHWLISNGILVMLILNLFRQGHYFLNGFPFFVLLYIYNYLSYHKPVPAAEVKESDETPALNS